MEIINQLSSQIGDKSEASNKIVAQKCIQTPKLLDDIVIGFNSKDKKLVGDCIEVFTMVSDTNPELIISYSAKIIDLLKSKETRIRWEATHSLANISRKIPDTILSILPLFQELIQNDKSIIVRDYSIDAIANLADVNEIYSEKAFELLKYSLELWGERHGKQVFQGFYNVLKFHPNYKNEIETLAEPFINAKKGTVAKAAKKVIKRANEIK